MEMKGFFTRKRVMFLLLFAILSFIGARINFSPLIGADNQFFTLFQFFAPISAAFLGPAIGVLSVFLAEIVNFVLLGKAFEPVNILRLAPMLFAAYYFGTRNSNALQSITIVPLIAILIFLAHPIGAQVWYFTLFWLIPLAMKVFFKNTLLAKSLGTTFTAHAVGGALWIWTIPMTVAAWNALIPIVAYERVLFALGIAVSYLVFNTVLSTLENRVSNISEIVNIDPNYILFKSKLKI